MKYGRQRFLTVPLMKWMFGKYVSDPAQRGNDLMSPVRASAERLRGLPPTLIAVAENDILRDEGEAMGRRLDEAGVEVTTVRFNGRGTRLGDAQRVRRVGIRRARLYGWQAPYCGTT